MFYLETARLLLIQTPLDVLQTRLQRDTFTADIRLPTTTLRVTFLAEWPGDALALFPMMIEQHQSLAGNLAWGGTIIDRAAQAAVGQMGFKGPPDEKGAVELGYGVNPSYQRRGYATEMAGALVAWALAQATVRQVTAECREDNVGSIRVLKKTGFRRVGRRIDDEDGPLLLWSRTGG